MSRENNMYTRAYEILQKEGIFSLIRSSLCYFKNKLKKPLYSKLWPLYYPAAEQYYKYSKDFDTDLYDAPLNPYKLVWVSPSDIERMTGRTVPEQGDKRIKNFGKVLDGKWDIVEGVSLQPWKPEKYGDNTWFFNLLADDKFEETIFFQSAKRHFEQEIPWEKTEFYDQVIDGLGSGKPPLPSYGRNMKEFEKKLSKIDNLYYRIEESGVLPDHQVRPRSYLRTRTGSILVDISREGELLFVEGRRRLTCAKLLDIKKVPVYTSPTS
ncbi:hypothetical protein [Methanonatronarchaeum sp. AMET6-2]|uniref:hypothetical protein n=1 Tax=Methanonatronarchaeum sp. AMET6-2 TaxID=2933293 RepID=UPI001FF6E7D8|nr:hypothetical protein [Methanonatronarchaeum sp. AMET6-2]UOY10283.1 hypothetical protein MU439_01230 [Methanonatronarchaeum sp. AMET6-2]